MEGMRCSINILGAGISGLCAAIKIARSGRTCNLISSMPSERAQSVLAEGGINAALDNMGENDTPKDHYADTMRGGCYLETDTCVSGLTSNAPDLVNWLKDLGVPFMMKDKMLVQRNFGGQKKKRTCYAKASTGKMIMTSLIDEVRKYEVLGLITRYPDHILTDVIVDNGQVTAIEFLDQKTLKSYSATGPVIFCCGGLNGLFEGQTTGTTQNTGHAQAILMNAGVEFANLEFIQYHPTTVAIADKRMLISEAARGEGGRLYVTKNGSPWYFMEEKYPELGNLMPRDIVSKEMFIVANDPDTEGCVYLDMRDIPSDTWNRKLSDLRNEIKQYLDLDPVKDPVPVKPGIHFFMGGIRVDDSHRTNIRRIYAAGECASKYHGANRLGGNSMLAAVYGGFVAAQSAMDDSAGLEYIPVEVTDSKPEKGSDPGIARQITDILIQGMGIIRDEKNIKEAIDLIDGLSYRKLSSIDRNKVSLAKACLMSALQRKESRGAHQRSDYPSELKDFQKTTCSVMEEGCLKIYFEDPVKEYDYGR